MIFLYFESQAKLKKGDDNGHGNKSYNSWLAWWRSTITTDDFLKFLSTQVRSLPNLLPPRVFRLENEEKPCGCDCLLS